MKNSILLANVEVGEKAELSMCVVAPKQAVAPKSKRANETVGDNKSNVYE